MPPRVRGPLRGAGRRRAHWGPGTAGAATKGTPTRHRPRRQPMTNGILHRIVTASGVADLLEALGERLTPTDLQSLLLEVYRRRAARQRPAGLLDQYERSRFVRPSPANPRLLVEFDRLAFSLAAPPFEPVELSPVCPLGTNSVVAPVSQNLTIATIRNTELVSDSTNVLALECALRRLTRLRSQPAATDRVRLCASHRLLRAQRFHRPGAFAHFRAFALCTAGRDQGAHRFELESLAEHLRFYLRLMAAWSGVGQPMHYPRVAITDLAGTVHPERLQAAVVDSLFAEFPEARVGLDADRTAGRGYYAGLCFHVYAQDRSRKEYELVDGGFTTWTQQLLSDRKERLLISGVGTERVCSVFG